jgi:SAM-dependent methyltransferase
MSETVYDEHVRMYVDFLDGVLAREPSLFREMLTVFERLLGSRLQDARVLDVACGEGYLSRFLAPLGPREVLGVDISSALIDIARERTDAPYVSFRIEDAQELASLCDASFDVAVSQMAVMDIADHRALFRSVHRVLQPDGSFVFSLLHPCFESPYRADDDPQRFVTDGEGAFTANVIRWYASEGHWFSPSEGVRGSVGSYHRMVSTYINDLISSGFRLERIEEPVMDVPGLFSQVPRVMIVAASRIG